MADKRDVFQIKGNQVALILDNELQEAKGEPVFHRQVVR